MTWSRYRTCVPSSPENEFGVPLELFNTLGRRLEPFVSREPGKASVYSCGPTVYAYQHIGNMRAYVFADTLGRVLRWKGYDVRHVINITDVGHLTSDEDEGEDKMEAGARREGRTIWEIAEHYTAAFMDDLASLRIVPPTMWTKATDHIPQMVAFAQVLEDHGLTYPLPSGLYYDTSKDDDYGKLALLDLEGLREGERVEKLEGRRNPSDFAVWRTTPPGESRQMEWDSPWGRGAPGWHLECSVMSIEHLGPHFDIHTGGVDHIPVHHTNEIAQSEGYLGDGQEWVRYWLHGEFINLRGAKISKSLGHTVRVTDLAADGYHPLVYRYLLLGAHYRAQVEFDMDALDGAKTALRRLLERFGAPSPAPVTTYTDAAARVQTAEARRYLDDLDAAISADLNTAKALAVVAAVARDDGLGSDDVAALVAAFDAVLGLGLGDLSAADMEQARAGVDVAEVERLFAERLAARDAKDWATSDALRDQLASMGVEVKDSAGGSTWSWR
jgi:cysteinyl-tRNA synthetase